MIDGYRIISSEEGDWFIAAKKTGRRIRVLTQGHSRAEAFAAVLEDLGVEVPVVERDMGEGTYKPRARDWE